MSATTVTDLTDILARGWDNGDPDDARATTSMAYAMHEAGLTAADADDDLSYLSELLMDECPTHWMGFHSGLASSTKIAAYVAERIIGSVVPLAA